MTFVTVSFDRNQLTALSQMLVTLFPGCTVHQSCDPVRALRWLSNQKVDAVFAEADYISHMVDFLSRQKLSTKILLLCGQNAAVPEEITGCYGILPYPITEQLIKNALK